LIAAASTTSNVESSGNTSQSAAAMESSAAGANGTDEKQTRSGSGDTDGSSSGTIYTFGFWLAVVFGAVILVFVVIWTIAKGVGKNEDAKNTDLIYKNLQDARQIYAKMMK
jgi:hypothetical protein